MLLWLLLLYPLLADDDVCVFDRTIPRRLMDGSDSFDDAVDGWLQLDVVELK
jgi:hypothetical protein